MADFNAIEAANAIGWDRYHGKGSGATPDERQYQFMESESDAFLPDYMAVNPNYDKANPKHIKEYSTALADKYSRGFADDGSKISTTNGAGDERALTNKAIAAIEAKAYWGSEGISARDLVDRFINIYDMTPEEAKSALDYVYSKNPKESGRQWQIPNSPAATAYNEIALGDNSSVKYNTPATAAPKVEKTTTVEETPLPKTVNGVPVDEAAKVVLEDDIDLDELLVTDPKKYMQLTGTSKDDLAWRAHHVMKDMSKEDILDWADRKGVGSLGFTGTLNNIYLGSSGISTNKKLVEAKMNALKAADEGRWEDAEKAIKEYNSLVANEKAFNAFVKSGGDDSQSNAHISVFKNLLKTKSELEEALASATGEEKLEIETSLKQLDASIRHYETAIRHDFDEVANMKSQYDKLGSMVDPDKYKAITFGLGEDRRAAKKRYELAKKSGDEEAIDSAKKELGFYNKLMTGLVLMSLGAGFRSMQVSGASSAVTPQPNILREMLQKNFAIANQRRNDFLGKAQNDLADFMVNNLKADSSIIDNINNFNLSAETQRMSNSLNRNEKIYSVYVMDKIGNALRYIDQSKLMQAVLFSAEGKYAPLMKFIATLPPDQLQQLRGSLVDLSGELVELAKTGGKVVENVADGVNDLLDHVNGFFDNGTKLKLAKEGIDITNNPDGSWSATAGW